MKNLEKGDAGVATGRVKPRGWLVKEHHRGVVHLVEDDDDDDNKIMMMMMLIMMMMITRLARQRTSQGGCSPGRG